MAGADVNGKGSRSDGDAVGGSSLTAKQLKYGQAYVENGGNSTDAARTAGYANPNECSDRLSKHDGIRSYIEEHRSHVAVRQSITHDWIVNAHKNLIGGKPSDYFKPDGEPIEPANLSNEAWTRIKGFKQTAHGIEYTFHDPAAINRDLAQWTKLVDAASTNLGPEEAAAMIAAALVAAEELNSGDAPD